MLVTQVSRVLDSKVLVSKALVSKALNTQVSKVLVSKALNTQVSKELNTQVVFKVLKVMEDMDKAKFVISAHLRFVILALFVLLFVPLFVKILTLAHNLIVVPG